MSETLFLKNLFILCKTYNKTDLNFYHQKPLFFLILQNRSEFLSSQNIFFTSHKADLIFWQIKIIFFNNKNRYDFFNKKKRFHPYINLCDLIFHSHVQHIMHDIHSIVHWSQESRRPDSVWVEWVTNTFPFRNLVSGFRFLV